ncbi:ATP-binding protein [Kineococcus rubinsiae]|uniref:ATP-binding protein n=1 Tax=Kineococcus rubinsiae TaxID=2609562 RepID=UPI00143157D9|nr:ATP-binding protein [Kineococcus rubinsiae]
MTDQDQGAGAARPPAALLELPADAAAVRAARRFVTAHLEAGGLVGLTADAELAVSELTANVVLHARTPMLVSVETTPTTARIGVSDGDPRPPVATAALSPALRARTGTTVSGRGLGLVAAVAVEWGILPRPPGKEIWFRLGPGQPATAPASVDPGELLDAWAALDAAAAADETVVAVIDDLPVQAMLEAKARMEDLVRDLRLALLHHEQGDAEPTTPADEEEVAVARMLDDAVTEFADGRSQLRRQVVEAASHGQRRVDLVVRLRPDQGGAVRRYRQALDAADELGRRGKLLLAGSLVEHADLRRTYLDEIIRQLEA